MTDTDEADPAAAEYVLGTLDGTERDAVRARMKHDGALRTAIDAWEARLGPLAEAAKPVEAPSHLLAATARRLFPTARGQMPVGAADVVALRASVRRWRAATAACAALAAALVLWVGFAPEPRERPQLVAVLQRDAGAPAMLLDVDLASRKLTVNPLNAASPAGKAYELWIIDPGLGAPRSLGTVPARRRTQASLSPYEPALITDATFAVTVEPEGGSPTGSPSGNPILLGHLSPSP